jgi:two-component system capsular synthesis sensor histidine kinase RcsC
MSETKRILAVDDEEQVLFVLRHTLEGIVNGFVVETASGGREALEKIGTQHYDLVLTDVRMPAVDGIALTKAIRSLGNHTAVLWLTAYGSSGMEGQAERLGVDRCLTKPLRIGAIRDAVREALHRAGSNRE